MTISTTEPRVLYTGNGSTTSFAVPFDFDADADLKVEVITASTNDVVLQVLTTDYSISSTNVVMNTAPAATERLLITLDLDYVQSTNYIANDPFPAETHENALDEIMKHLKQLKQEVDRNVPKLPSNILTSTTVTDTDIAADKVFGINSAGDGIQLGSVTDLVDINGLTSVTPATNDEIMFADASDSFNIKKATIQELIDTINEGSKTQMTAGENINVGDIVYINTDGNVYKAIVNGTAVQSAPMGIAQTTVTSGNTLYIRTSGVDTTQSGLSAGVIYYLDSSAGAISSNPPSSSGDHIVRIGVGKSSTELSFEPQFIYVRN